MIDLTAEAIKIAKKHPKWAHASNALRDKLVSEAYEQLNPGALKEREMEEFLDRAYDE